MEDILNLEDARAMATYNKLIRIAGDALIPSKIRSMAVSLCRTHRPLLEITSMLTAKLWVSCSQAVGNAVVQALGYIQPTEAWILPFKVHAYPQLACSRMSQDKMETLRSFAHYALPSTFDLDLTIVTSAEGVHHAIRYEPGGLVDSLMGTQYIMIAPGEYVSCVSLSVGHLNNTSISNSSIYFPPVTLSGPRQLTTMLALRADDDQTANANDVSRIQSTVRTLHSRLDL